MAGGPSTGFLAMGHSAISALGCQPLLLRTGRFTKNSSISVTQCVSHDHFTRSRFSLTASQMHGDISAAPRTGPASSLHCNHATRMVGRGAGHFNRVDKYGQFKCIEDALTSIMTDAIQHSLGKENDVMRSKVLDQMGSGLAALCRVSVGVAAASSNAPIPELSTIRDTDLKEVQRLLHLMSLPFNTTAGEDFKRVMKLLQKTTDDGQGAGKRTLSESELSEVCERLRSDLIQCVGPLVMCFPELPLWAKQRSLLLPAEIAGKMALSLLKGPSRR